MPESEAEPVPRVPRAEVRRRVLDAAARVFAEHGYAETRLDDIARAAGFTKGAVYSNFGSKQDLFVALLTERSEADKHDVNAAIDQAGDVVEATVHATAVLAERLVRDAAWNQLILEFASRAGRDERVREVFRPFRRDQRARVAGHLAEHAERLGVTASVDLDQAAMILMALLNGLALENAVDPEAVTADVMGSTVAAVVAGLIRPIPEP